MSLPPALDSEELLAHVGWVRSLALQVARDPHVADDLTQDALLVALSARSERPRSVRRWLAAVVRNLGRTKYRSESRRARREASVERSTTAPSTLELVERAATQRALVGALLALEEPYRSTLLQRFFEERSARAIAKRMGLSESTIATRTAEGLRRLRSRLSREGDERSWLSSLLPLLRWPKKQTSFAPMITGAVAVSIQVKICLGAALISSALLAYFALDAPRPAEIRPPGRTLSTGEASDLVAAADERTGRSAPLQESHVDSSAPHLAQVTMDAGTRPIRGHVIDMSGEPVPDVEVCSLGSNPPMDGQHGGVARRETVCSTSDANGEFVIELDPPFQLTARSEIFATVFEGWVGGDRIDAWPVVIVAHRIPLAGIVVDEAGNGVGATITYYLTDLPLESLGIPLDASRIIVPRARSDARGTFAFIGAPEIEGSRVEVRAAGFLAAVVPIPSGGDDDLRIVLTRPESGKEALVGRVVHADDSPAVDARVSAGRRSVPTDAEGWFVLDLEQAVLPVERDEPLTLAAVSEGLLPATLALPSIVEAEESGWPENIVLRLGGPPLTIRGRVVDEAGEGLRGVSVAAIDVTPFGLIPGPRANGFVMRTLEDIAGGGATLTEADGAFELMGLLDRSYRLEAMHPRSLLSTKTEPIDAGSAGVRVVLDRRTLGRVAGRVVDRTGQGLAGVRVAVSRKWPGELAIGVLDVSDAQGRFRLDGVTTEPHFLRLTGEAIVPDLFRQPEAGADLTALELVVERRCRLQFDWGDWFGRADELRVVDENERPLDLMTVGGGSISHPQQSMVVEVGLSGVVVVSDAAVHAVLLLDGMEVTRFRLSFVPGELELLEL